MATEQRLERLAAALVEDSLLGGPVACEKYKVTTRTLERWRALLRTDPRLRRLYNEKMSRIDAEFADSLTTRPALIAVRRDGRARSKGVNRREALELADAAAAEIAAVAALAGWPEVKSAERSHALPSGRRVSLLVAHRDGSYTACEVLSASSGAYERPLGHLLFCFEAVRMHYRLPASSVRLCVLSDGNAPPLWNRVVANLKVEVSFFNIAEAVRARLDVQNVLTSDPETVISGSEVDENMKNRLRKTRFPPQARDPPA